MQRLRFVWCILASLAAGAASVAEAAADDTADFFNGKDLAGWEGLPKYWSVKDEAIVGTTHPDGGKFNTFLCSKKKYKDFELTFQVKLLGPTGNSGVQIRSRIFDQEHMAVSGPQCDMGAQYWGSLYGERFDGKGGLNGSMMKAAPPELVKKVLKADEFNHYSIRCIGKHVTIKLNGETTVDQDFSQLPDDGIIAWQLHAGRPMEVTFKNIKFTELKRP
jgi:Domain of Unknown Function (DUF1080)